MKREERNSRPGAASRERCWEQVTSCKGGSQPQEISLLTGTCLGLMLLWAHDIEAGRGHVVWHIDSSTLRHVLSAVCVDRTLTNGAPFPYDSPP